MPKSEVEDRKAPDVMRLSVSVDAVDYADLKQIAAEKRVSVAWVVRDAVAAYLDARAPLFARMDQGGGP